MAGEWSFRRVFYIGSNFTLKYFIFLLSGWGVFFFQACKNTCVSLSYGQPALPYKSPLYMFLATGLIKRKIDRFIEDGNIKCCGLCVPDTLLRLLRCTASQLHPHSVAARWGKPPSAASEVINFTLAGVGSHSWSAVKSRRAGFQRERGKKRKDNPGRIFWQHRGTVL